MNIVETICPECSASLEFPSDSDNVVCAVCGATHQVRNHNGAISLRVIQTGPLAWERPAANEPGLDWLDELIAEIESDIEGVRAREQSGPLQLGCAVFGIFVSVLAIIVVFMLVGRSLVGGWVFYVTLALVTLLGVARLRAKLKHQTPASELRARRAQLEETLTELQRERSRLTK
jgi:hypothetical protein